MKIITIFNFPDEENNNRLCNWWCEQTDKYREGLPVEVWTKDFNSCLRYELPQNFQLLEKKEVDAAAVLLPNAVTSKAQHNIGFKLYNLTQETEPFIFIDADAILLDSVGPLIEASRDQPFIAVNHQKIEGHTAHIPVDFLNSGLQVWSDPSAMPTFDQLSSIKNFGLEYPGTDQSILNTVCRIAGYDYTHPDVGLGWNSCAGLTEVIDGEAFCNDRGFYYKVHLNHYWYSYKPWLIDCPLYNEYVRTKNE